MRNTVEVMNAACSIAKTPEDVAALSRTRIGAIVIGSITVNPREGNPEPRWHDGGGYALNSFGMPNGGIEYYADHLPKMVRTAHDSDKDFILSIAGFTAAEYIELAALAEDTQVDAVELNLGCPNVSVDGVQKPIASFDTDSIEEIVRGVRKATEAPLRLKVSPYSNPAELTRVAEKIADLNTVSAVVTSNTFPNSYLPSEDGAPYLASEVGGLSGEALRPIALGQVRAFRKLLPEHIDVIGAGGIETKDHVRLYRMAGACAVQAATLIVRDGHSAINRLV